MAKIMITIVLSHIETDLNRLMCSTVFIEPLKLKEVDLKNIEMLVN